MTEAIKIGPLQDRYFNDKEHQVSGHLISTPSGDRFEVQKQRDHIAVAWSTKTSSTQALQETLRLDTSEKVTLNYCDSYDHRGEVNQDGYATIIGGGWHEDVQVDYVLEQGDEKVVAWGLDTGSAYYYYGGSIGFEAGTRCLGFNIKESNLSLARRSLVLATAKPGIVERLDELIEMSEIS